MFSLKLSQSHLVSIRETEVMIKKINEQFYMTYSELKHVTVKTTKIVNSGTYLSVQIKGGITKNAELITVKAVMQMSSEAGEWLPVKMNLLLKDEHYDISYIGRNSYVHRSYKGQYPG